MSKSHYSCSLKLPDVPCLNVGTPRKPIYLPPEVCIIAPGQRRLKLDEKQTAAMIKSAAQKPDERAYNIGVSVNDKGRLPQDPHVRAFGMDIQQDMMSVWSSLPLSLSPPLCVCVSVSLFLCFSTNVLSSLSLFQDLGYVYSQLEELESPCICNWYWASIVVFEVCERGGLSKTSAVVTVFGSASWPTEWLHFVFMMFTQYSTCRLHPQFLCLGCLQLQLTWHMQLT